MKKSSAVDLDDALGKTLFSQEAGNLKTLIALQLNNLSEFFVFDESAVARKFLNINDTCQ